MDLIIKNGTLVTASGMFKADLGVTGEKITAIGSDLNDNNAKKIDVAGKLVLPGAIDGHTHLASESGALISSDDYYTGTVSAACGGTTTVIDYAMQNVGEPMQKTLNRRQLVADPDAVVDYSFHIGVQDVRENLLDSMAEAVKAGVPTFKVYMVYDFGVPDGVFYQLIEQSKKIGARINVHAENKEMIRYFTSKFLAEGKTDAWHHYLSRPEFVEGEADSRAITWAKNLNASLYIVHLANKYGVEYVSQAKQEGYEIYAETCPQYLEFTCDVFKRPDGRNFVCSPPMKDLESQNSLWAAIRRGDIDTIATDHCPFLRTEKDLGKNDFSRIPNGCGGIENMYPYMLSAANTGKITWEKAVELCSTNPACIFGCKQKGSLVIGKDADIVIYDPKKEFVIHQNNMHSACDYTIWEGVKLLGYPVQTYCRGTLVFDKGNFVGTRGFGRFVKRSLI